LKQQLAAAQAAAAAAEEQASSQHQAQLDGLSAGHAARIQQLQSDLAANAAKRADLESQIEVSCSDCHTSNSAGLMVTALQRCGLQEGECPNSLPCNVVCVVRVQALQQQHAKAAAALHSELQGLQAHNQALQDKLAASQQQLQEAPRKLAAAEEAAAAARAEASRQLATAAKEQQTLRQQQLELRTERLQLQQQLEAQQHASSSSQQMVDQLAAAQRAAVADQAQLQGQLEQQQRKVQAQAQQLEQQQLECLRLQQVAADANVGREAAARQAAAAGHKLAAALASQDTLRQQLEVRPVLSDSNSNRVVCAQGTCNSCLIKDTAGLLGDLPNWLCGPARRCLLRVVSSNSSSNSTLTTWM
jgi:hypothetical protein